MDEWKPGDSGWAVGTMAGGPFDGATYGDLPNGQDGEPPVRACLPTVGTGGPYALYDREAGTDGGWLYLFVGMSAVSTPHAPLPAGGTVQHGDPAALPALRFRVAQSWWIAAELVRRHPTRHVVEDGDRGDVLRVLRPHDDGSAPDRFCDLDRARGVRAGLLHLDLVAVLAADSPHEVVRAVETARRRRLRGRAPATTARALTYRVAARLLATRVDDRATWDVRGDWVQSAEGGGTCRGFLHGLPTALKAVETADARPTLTDGAEHFWAVLRDGERRGVLDDAGVLHTPEHAIDLLPLYRRRHRLSDVMAVVLEEVAR